MESSEELQNLLDKQAEKLHVQDTIIKSVGKHFLREHNVEALELIAALKEISLAAISMSLETQKEMLAFFSSHKQI